MSSNKLLVKTNYGPVQGEQRTSSFGYKFNSFRGIPYAKPPIGDLRFKDPLPADPWTSVFHATKDGHAPIQLGMFDGFEATNISEDCLVLNVFTKELKPKKPLPVMIWIYGGGFRTGSSEDHTYNPEFLLQKDVLVITFNYRLGVLGFLSIDDPSVEVPGNAGLKDQTLALKWARENVQFFGGDNKNITIFGESAGGASVHFHTISDHSKGLFDKAIVMSGSGISDWCNIPRKNWAEQLALKLGWTGTAGNAREYYEFLKNVDPVTLSKVSMIITQQATDIDDKKVHSPFLPSVEPYVAKQSFYAKPIRELYKNSWGNSIPLIIGGTADEGLLFYRLLKMFPDKSEDDFLGLVPDDLCFGARQTDKCKELALRIKQFYYSDVRSPADIFDKTLELIGDSFFWKDIYAVVRDRVQNPKCAPTYFYHFSFETTGILRGMFAIAKESTLNLEIKGACHADDVPYLFKNDFLKDIVSDPRNNKLMQRMVSLYTEFAIKGDPNSKATKSIVWKPVDAADKIYNVLDISDELSIVPLPKWKRCTFWESLYN